jgi:hypothetical protein
VSVTRLNRTAGRASIRRHDLAFLHGLTILVAGMTVLFAGHASVAAQSAGLNGVIHRGNCDRLTNPVSDLTPLLFGTSERRGSSEAIPVASSFSTIPVSFDALLIDDHAVATSRPGGDVIACGEIGGTRGDDGTLIIGLRSEEGSAITGIAYLAPSSDASQTDVSLFLAGEPLVEIAVAQAQEEETYATDIVRITQSMMESFGAFATLIESPRVGQENWTIELTAQFAIWDSNYGEALALSPPPVFAESHALLVEALRLYSEANDDFATALDTRDRAMMNQAVSEIAQADEMFGLAVAEADRIRQERSE